MNRQRLLKIILGACVTEKSVRLGMLNQYVFKVLMDAKKPEVKEAVEQLFDVEVSSVSILVVKPKTCQFKGKLGKHKGWKKAYVTLKPGNNIDMFGEFIKDKEA